ncbi:hypothetical protein KAR48_07410 [bacterium]|nr:hypothetical protein [bacterium]
MHKENVYRDQIKNSMLSNEKEVSCYDAGHFSINSIKMTDGTSIDNNVENVTNTLDKQLLNGAASQD